MKLSTIKESDQTQPTIHVLIGLPGSGKSTWIKGRDLSNTVVVSSDDIIEQYAKDKGKTYSEVYDECIGFATKTMKENFRNAIEANLNVIWDQTNMSKKKRRGILSQVPKHYVKIAVDFDVDDKVLYARLQKRAEETGKFIPEHVIKSMGASYQAPTKDEGFDKIIRI